MRAPVAKLVRGTPRERQVPSLNLEVGGSLFGGPVYFFYEGLFLAFGPTRGGASTFFKARGAVQLRQYIVFYICLCVRMFSNFYMLVYPLSGQLGPRVLQ